MGTRRGWRWVLAAVVAIGAVAGGAHPGPARAAGPAVVVGWGDNRAGQLGAGDTLGSAVPVQVTGLGGIVAIAAGNEHSLALGDDGVVWGWGRNDSGQLGDGSLVNRAQPVRVHGLDRATVIVAGTADNLAIRDDGTPWAWGANNGQLGDGTITGRMTPVPVSGLTGITTAVATGVYHTLALIGDGTVRAWGGNDNGQLGDGTTISQLVPIPVVGLAGTIAVAAGFEHSLALTRDGIVWAWGRNQFGELGDATTPERHLPARVAGMSGVVAIAAGYGHFSLALKGDGTVWAWGANTSGQLGDGTTEDRATPARVGTLTDIVAIATLWGHSLALKRDGTVWAWGTNASGELGDGTESGTPCYCRTLPVPVSGLTGVIAVAAGSQHSLALKDDGTVWAWGANWSGALGVADRLAARATPATVGPPAAPVAGATAIAAGPAHALALLGDGTVRAWGANISGQLGDGTARGGTTPVRVSGLTGVVAVAAGDYRSLALAGDGAVWAWGYNGDGMLGDGSQGVGGGCVCQPAPVRVTGLSGVAAIAIGYLHSLALRGDGTVWSWGENFSGELGDGTTTARAAPVPVSGLSGVVAIAAGPERSLALKGDGTVWGWGRAPGDGSTGRETPVRISGLAGVVAIAAGAATPPVEGGGHSLALKGDGTVWAWGNNDAHQLGDGTTTARLAPVQVAGLGGVAAIAAGSHFSLALKGDGTVWAWGSNAYGQGGPGPAVDLVAPAQQPGLTGATAIAAGGTTSYALIPGGSATLTLATTAGGAVEAATAADIISGPPAARTYAQWASVPLIPRPAPGYTFTGWTIDGAPAGWVVPLRVSLSAGHSVVATFAPTRTFPDAAASRVDAVSVRELATRGAIRGYEDGTYGPGNGLLRAQIAALIARATAGGTADPAHLLTPPACLVAGSWDCETWGNAFTDQGATDAALWRDVGVLQHYGVANGYDGLVFGPGDAVTHGQAISLIARTMRAKGRWADQHRGAQPYPGTPASHDLDVRTFVAYTGVVPDHPVGWSTADWNRPATRGWFARALWLALDSADRASPWP